MEQNKYVDQTGLSKVLNLLKKFLDENKVTEQTVEGWGFIKSETSGVVFEYDPESNSLNITGSNTSVVYDEETKTLDITV